MKSGAFDRSNSTAVYEVFKRRQCDWCRSLPFLAQVLDVGFQRNLWYRWRSRYRQAEAGHHTLLNTAAELVG